MNILFDIGHPAHVHLFRNFIKYLIENGHRAICTTRDKEMTNALMEHYSIPYICLSRPGRGLFGMLWELIRRDIKIFFLHRKYRFDIAFGTSVSIAHLSLFSKVKSYNFNEDDDEVVPLYTKITYPFTTKIINPDCIRFKKWKNKRILVNSYHELAYLHPNHFTPDRNVIAKYGLEEGKYVIARFSALQAHHDTKAKGISKELWDKIENLLRGYTIIKSIERSRNYQIEPWDMHHVMAFAKMVISDSQTMTAEAAVLGVPSVRQNSFVGKISYLKEMEHRYQLTFGYPPGENEKVITKIKELLQLNSINSIWYQRKNILLQGKIDFNNWMINFFINRKHS